MPGHDELKKLCTLQTELQAQKRQIEADVAALSRDAKEAEKRLADVNKQIAALMARNAGVVITEHAILRFIERVLLMDIEGFKAMMMPPNVKDQIQTCWTGKFPVYDKQSDRRWHLRAKKGKVVTVLTDEKPKAPREEDNRKRGEG